MTYGAETSGISQYCVDFIENDFCVFGPVRKSKDENTIIALIPKSKVVIISFV